MTERRNGDRRVKGNGSRLERSAEHIALRLISRWSNVALVVIIIPLVAWSLAEVYDSAMKRMETNTKALQQNQAAYIEMVGAQTEMKVDIRINRRDIDNDKVGRQLAWRLWDQLRGELAEQDTRLVRVETLQRIGGN